MIKNRNAFTKNIVIKLAQAAPVKPSFGINKRFVAIPKGASMVMLTKL